MIPLKAQARHNLRRGASLAVCCLLVPIAALLARPPSASDSRLSQPQLQQTLDYISKSWDSLTRSVGDCKSVEDQKTGAPQILYAPSDVPMPEAFKATAASCAFQIQTLPEKIYSMEEQHPAGIDPPGLLFLPNQYVVPGGRFNEMYGWDSYFVIRGLLLSGKIDLAKGIVRNFFFEIDHYGGVLNANRTYYLTRSQPPFLTSMILAVYDAEKLRGKDDREWLREAFPRAVRDHDSWLVAGHQAGQTKLSSYYDYGDGPVPEMADSPGYYQSAANYFAHHPESGKGALVQSNSRDAYGPAFNVSPCSQIPGEETPGRANCMMMERVNLTRDFYKGDRSMRESGFDTTFRFGPYGAATHHFAAVDLNSLLYKSEADLSRMAAILGGRFNPDYWRAQAEKRQTAVNRYCWNRKSGLFFDYDFVAKKQSTYEFVSTFYPLWAGLASKEQAAAVEKHLSDFEKPGGLQTSTQITGAQWDAPYGWAPIQLIAVEGLRRYGFNADADRISREFLSDVLDNFQRDGNIREKYDVVQRTTDTNIQAGYTQNVVGFGWTNGVFLALLRELDHPNSATPPSN